MRPADWRRCIFGHIIITFFDFKGNSRRHGLVSFFAIVSTIALCTYSQNLVAIVFTTALDVFVTLHTKNPILTALNVSSSYLSYSSSHVMPFWFRHNRCPHLLDRTSLSTHLLVPKTESTTATSRRVWDSEGTLNPRCRYPPGPFQPHIPRLEQTAKYEALWGALLTSAH